MPKYFDKTLGIYRELDDSLYPGKLPGDIVCFTRECECGAKYNVYYKLRAVPRGDDDTDEAGYDQLALDECLGYEKIAKGTQNQCFYEYETLEGETYYCTLEVDNMDLSFPLKEEEQQYEQRANG